MQVAGRVALVTGASRGIGREIALALGRRGASLALVARDRKALGEVARQIDTERVLVAPADLADLAQLRAAYDAAVARFGRVDILVNNAGLVGDGDLLDSAAEELAQIVDVNFRATVVLTRLAAEGMAARGSGHIVNVASLAGVTGVAGAATYAGTKAALRLFTASLRPELGPRGVVLTDVVLGFITTDMLDQVESNRRVRTLFDRARRLRLMVDTPARDVGEAVAHAIEQRQSVVVIPPWARYVYLPLQGVTRTLVQALTPR